MTRRSDQFDVDGDEMFATSTRESSPSMRVAATVLLLAIWAAVLVAVWGAA